MTQLIDHAVLDMTLAVPIESLKEEKSDAHDSSLEIELPLLDARCNIQIHRVSRTYLSSDLSYIALEIDQQNDWFRIICEETAIEAFQRLVISISGEEFYLPKITVALYEFLTFTEAYGWQPVFFGVTERVAPILRSHGLETVKQQFQGSEFRYLAYRNSELFNVERS